MTRASDLQALLTALHTIFLGLRAHTHSCAQHDGGQEAHLVHISTSKFVEIFGQLDLQRLGNQNAAQ